MKVRTACVIWFALTLAACCALGAFVLKALFEMQAPVWFALAVTIYICFSFGAFMTRQWDSFTDSLK